MSLPIDPADSDLKTIRFPATMDTVAAPEVHEVALAATVQLNAALVSAAIVAPR